ncbi:MAG TPA: YfiR family protein [Nitrosomonas sp.]|nr:YfiR family protein [Nitrosomonas sp.]
MADSPGACHQGVILNMNVNNEKVTFEANLMMAKKAGLNLSSQLLRLATEIYQ